MKRIKLAIQQATYTILKDCLMEKGQWEKRRFAATWEAFGQIYGYRADILMLDYPSTQLNHNFYKERPHLNPDTLSLYSLCHIAKTAQLY